MVLWIKTKSGRAIRLEDSWAHSIYVACHDKRDLEALVRNGAVQHYIKEYEYVERLERITDHERSEVLRLVLRDSRRAVSLATTIEDIGFDKFRVYNVDVLPSQAYFYEHDLFPLARCKVAECGSRLVWEVDDDLGETDYEIPNFRIANLDVKGRQEGRLPKFSDKIDSITLGLHNGEVFDIRKESEEESLYELMSELRNIDPDFIFTAAGDGSIFPYLLERARTHHVQLQVSREPISIAELPKQGITYFSYGRIHYRPSTVMLYGRVHIDTHNSFILDHSALNGLYEIARLCRIPFHTCARATIGRCLSSLQMYHAFKKGLLVPWRPVNTEKWKSLSELFVADRGGLIFEPVVGVHENVAEFDFASLYPSIMMKRNVSGETVNCDCCPDSTNIVGELGYHICMKRRGIVSQALELPLEKRAKYKSLKKLISDGVRHEIYDVRQGALKWIGVVSFGYLGHANSKFGLIDSHIVVCAIDREVLIKARNVIEDRGFTNLHGIVDSLWAYRPNATKKVYENLKEPIEKETGFDVSFEGVYKWIVFLPSKTNPLLPVPNRYFGCFEDGNVIKDRGIETRRHDTPPLFSRFQKEILEIMGEGDTKEEVIALMPRVKGTFLEYRKKLLDGRVPLTELIFTKMLSKDSSVYVANTVQTGAISQLQDEGKSMRAGEILQYVITDYYRTNSRKRTIPVQLITEKTNYDARRYVELLAETCNSVTLPFGYRVSE